MNFKRLSKGADVLAYEESEIHINDPYQVAIQKLTEYFAPKHHEAFERHLFWQMKPEEGEPIEKFILRAQKKAASCGFGSDVATANEKSILDKIIQCAPNALKNRLFEKERLTLDMAINMVNTFKSVNYQAQAMSDSPQETSQG